MAAAATSRPMSGSSFGRPSLIKPRGSKSQSLLLPAIGGLSASSSAPLLPSVRTGSMAGSFDIGSASMLGSIAGSSIYSKGWTTEQKRLMHERRQRQWLSKKAKHSYIDFSDSERKSLRRYFDALAENSGRIRLDKLEDMLISLGVANSREDVWTIVEALDGDGSGELDFEEYLEIVRTRTDSNIFQVFKSMMEGKLGDTNLNFQTVISTYRRQLILDATGSRSAKKETQERGSRILQNFANLQRSRHEDRETGSYMGPGGGNRGRSDSGTGAASVADSEGVSHRSTARGGGISEGGESNAESPRSGSAASGYAAQIALIAPAFDAAMGHAPLGGMEMVWRGVCHEHDLVSSRPSSADGADSRRVRRSIERPPSPQTVISSIVKRNILKKNKFAGQGGTVIVQAPAMEERRGSKEDGRGDRADRVRNSGRGL